VAWELVVFGVAGGHLAAPGMLAMPVCGLSERPNPGGSVRSEDSYRAKCYTEPVAQHQQAAGELFHLPVRAQYRYVSCQILHLWRVHCPVKPGPMTRAECIRNDEVQALAKGGRRAVPEQHLGTGTPPRNGPVGIGDNDGVIRHVTYPALLRNQAEQRQQAAPCLAKAAGDPVARWVEVGSRSLTSAGLRPVREYRALLSGASSTAHVRAWGARPSQLRGCLVAASGQVVACFRASETAAQDRRPAMRVSSRRRAPDPQGPWPPSTTVDIEEALTWV
jgi:hypothetical protein